MDVCRDELNSTGLTFLNDLQQRYLEMDCKDERKW